jgi:hypothetical protein
MKFGRGFSEGSGACEGRAGLCVATRVGILCPLTGPDPVAMEGKNGYAMQKGMDVAYKRLSWSIPQQPVSITINQPRPYLQPIISIEPSPPFKAVKQNPNHHSPTHISATAIYPPPPVLATP